MGNQYGLYRKKRLGRLRAAVPYMRADEKLVESLQIKVSRQSISDAVMGA